MDLDQPAFAVMPLRMLESLPNIDMYRMEIREKMPTRAHVNIGNSH